MIPTYDIKPIRYSAAPDTIQEAEQAADRANMVEQIPYVPGENWEQYAECGHPDVDPELFHPTGDVQTRAQIVDIIDALTVCDGCPVIAACRARRYDMNASASVWGGVYYPIGVRGRQSCSTPGCARGIISSHRPFCGFDHEHAAAVGTRHGYDLHREHGDEPCEPCRANKRGAAGAARAGSGGTRGLRIGGVGSRVASR